MKKSKVFYLLLSLILVGAFLRFYRIETLTTYLTDQAIELNDTMAISRGDLKLIGIKTSLSQVRNGAVIYYLLLPFLIAFNFDPIAGGVLQSLLSLATIPIAFALAKEAKNNLSGLIAAGMVALSPLLVEYSRQTMAAYYPLFFTSLGFYLLISTTKRYTPQKAFFLAALSGFTLQIHYLSFTLMVLVFLKLKKNLPLILGALFGLSPIILFELSHQFFNTKALISYIQNPPPAADRIPLINYFPELYSRLFTGNHLILGAIVLVLILIMITYKFKSTSVNLVERTALLHLVISKLSLFFFANSLWYHYLLPGFISLFILTASSLAWLIEKRPVLKPALAVLTVVLLLVNFPAYRLNADHGADMSPGWNLKGVKKAAAIISADITPQQPFNVVMMVDAQNQAYPLRYLLAIKHKTPLEVSQYDLAHTLYVVSRRNFNFAKAQPNTYELNSFGSLTNSSFWPLPNNYQLVKFTK